MAACVRQKTTEPVGACPAPAPPPEQSVPPQITPLAYQDPLELLNTSEIWEIQEVRMRASDERVFLCTGVFGMLAVNATDPTNMFVESQMRSALNSGSFPRCQHVALEGTTAFMASRGDQFQGSFVAAFDTSTTPPVEIGNASIEGWSFEGIVADGGYLYAAAHQTGIAVFDSTLTMRASLGSFDNAWGVALRGTTLYVADAGGALVAVDVTTPTQPLELGRIDLAGTPRSIAIDEANSIAWVAAGAGGLYSVDISVPANLAQLGHVNTPGSALEVEYEGGFAYLADWRDVRIFDVTDPANPNRVVADRVFPEKISLSRVLGIAVHNGVVYAGEWSALASFQHYPGRTAPHVWVDQPYLEFSNIAPGCMDTAWLPVANHGNEPLVVRDLYTLGDSFVVDRMPVTLQPGESTLLEIYFAPDESKQQFGSLFLETDDPDEATREVELTGNRRGFGPGDAAPEVVVAVAGGGEWRLSEQSGPVLLAYFSTF